MKLPINPLLYLVSAASLAGIGYSIWGVMRPEPAMPEVKVVDAKGTRLSRAQVQKAIDDAIVKNVAARREAGRKLEPDQGRWLYDAGPFWLQFANANMIGYVKPVEVKQADKPTQTEPVAKKDIDLGSEVLTIVCILHGDPTWVVLQYKGNVTVPETERRITGTSPGAPGRGPAPSMGATPTHQLAIGQPLWPPHDKVFLVDVDKDANWARFEMRDRPRSEDGKYPVQTVACADATFTGEALQGYREWLMQVGGKPIKKAGTTEDPDKSAVVMSDLENLRRQDETIRRGDHVIPSHKVIDDIAKDMQRFVHDDVHMRDVSSGSGSSRVEGVQVTKVSGRAAEFGAEPGDLIVSLNGNKVKGRANAVNLGKKLYRQDHVRTFRVGFYRRGQYMERVVHLK